jgi:YbbR domain-containing protein
MIIFLRKWLKNLPTLIFAFTLAFIAWVAAVNSSDPSEQKTFSSPVAIQVLGQDPAMVIQGEIALTVNVVINAPRSVWVSLNAQPSKVKAFLDLSGLDTGTHFVPIQVQVEAKPIQVISTSPQQVSVTLERLTSRSMPINLVTTGSPDIGYEVGVAVIKPVTCTVSGPTTLINSIKQVRAAVSLLQARETLQVTLPLQAVDVNGEVVDGVTFNPSDIAATIPVNQKGGYRNVVVKVITQGSLANGYRLSNISVNPPTVTVYSSDPAKVEALPGYVETTPINLESLRQDINIPVDLNLAEGISLVGQQQVTIQIGIDAIESSVSFTKLKIIIENLSPGMTAIVSPELVDVILSGPLPVLEKIKSENIQIIIDLKGKIPGTYQIIPIVITNSDEVHVESVLPGTIEVVVQSMTPTPKP